MKIDLLKLKMQELLRLEEELEFYKKMLAQITSTKECHIPLVFKECAFCSDDNFDIIASVTKIIVDGVLNRVQETQTKIDAKIKELE